jgi:RNA polymerase sigma-70 factor (ECF subfamily)
MQSAPDRPVRTFAELGGGDGVPDGSVFDSAMDAGLDDATLLRRAQYGYLDAFELLVRRHRLRVFRLALRMLGNRSDAEDVAQQAFLDAWKGLPRFRAESTVTTWLYRITVNRCLEHRRRYRSTAELDEGRPDAHPGPEQALETTQRRQALTAAISALPDDLRAALVLSQFEGLSYDETADVLGISTSTVRGRISRARQQLLEQLKGWA